VAIPQVTASSDQIRDLWHALIGTLATSDAVKDDSLRDLWSGAARDGIVPQSLPAAGGEVPLAQVFVTGSPDLARRARTQGHVVVTLDADAISLWLASGAHDLAELMKPQWTESTGPMGLLLATIPELNDVVRPEVRDTARCRPVAGLRLLLADEASPMPCLMWEDTLLVDTGQLALLSRVERLQHLLAELAAAGWLKHDANEALRILGDAEVDRLRAFVAAGLSLGERLLRAVGNRDEPLRQAMGVIGRSDFLQQVAMLQLAELVLAQLGPATLTTLKETLEKEGLKPPSRWNTGEARAFVASIGFPEEFAASPESRREAEEFISGPIELPPLHDFQEEVLGGIRELIARGPTRRRAVVSLPTGGGKTRVTVEAAVLLVLKPECCPRSVIWVAQTDELCEQAVQAFRQVWLNLGAQKTDLRIVRLWGGNPNPATPEPDKPVVVVASIQTLNSRMAAEGLAWLRKPGLVVVDECHHAITPSYTNLLRFIDAVTPRPSEPPKDEPPILGLSATPFRTDDEESQRLARRFDSRWLPANQEDLHRRLRDQGVLAEVDNEALDSGIGLTPEEIERLSKLPEPWEGIDFENLLESINQRLAGNKQRNERLVERIEGAEERSILLFANSVRHAEEMAARLNLQGIKAAAVSGDTPTIARRYFLPRFQVGEIRVLCNHSVLSTGFDAPKTDMVLISRAVFSPVRYMQMVGRGLRGEKNGGKPRCRIVTVLDNLGRFEDRHPYHYCSSLFAP
jgi:superfamily II DNA or RNA helicase